MAERKKANTDVSRHTPTTAPRVGRLAEASSVTDSNKDGAAGVPLISRGSGELPLPQTRTSGAAFVGYAKPPPVTLEARLHAPNLFNLLF